MSNTKQINESPGTMITPANGLLFCVTVLLFVASAQSEHNRFKSLTDNLNHYEFLRFKRDGQTQPQDSNASSFKIRANMLTADLFVYGEHLVIIAYRTPHHYLNLNEGRLVQRLIPILSFEGRIRGQPNSVVQLYVWNGRLLGHIKDAFDNYQLEWMHHDDLSAAHKRDLTSQGWNKDTPTVLVYRRRDIKQNFEEQDLDASFVDDPRFIDQVDALLGRPLNRKGRTFIDPYPYRPKTRTCFIKLTADHHLYKAFRNNSELVANELHFITMMVNQLFRNFPIDKDFVTFHMTSVTVVPNGLPSDDPPGHYLEDYDEKSGNQVLFDFSMNLNTHCISLLMAGRSFGATVGLAYVKQSRQFGMCAETVLRKNGQGEDAPLVPRKMNIGFVSLKSAKGYFFSRFPVAATMAHEIGHLMGSFHDNEKKCPGFWLMYPARLDKPEPSTLMASACTLKAWEAGLHNLTVQKIKCLSITRKQCGNGWIDPGEECDCGDPALCQLMNDCCEPKKCHFRKGCTESSLLNDFSDTNTFATFASQSTKKFWWWDEPVNKTNEDEPTKTKRIKYKSKNTLICELDFTLDPWYVWAYKNANLADVYQKLLLIVLRVNRIFEKYTFGDKKILFRLRNITRLDPYDENGPGPQRKMPDFVLDHTPTRSNEYLKMFSFNMQDACASILVHQFTFKNPEEGIPGDAYLKHSDKNGACAIGYPYKKDKDGNVLRRQLNVALLNTGGRNGPFFTQYMAVNLAHYLAKLLGAPIDFRCKEKSIMHPKAWDLKPDEVRFSPCTIRSITDHLQAGHIGCLKTLEPVCGNGYLEPGERCDCGTKDMCKLLKDCCIPKKCKLRKNCIPKIPNILDEYV